MTSEFKTNKISPATGTTFHNQSVTKETRIHAVSLGWS